MSSRRSKRSLDEGPTQTESTLPSSNVDDLLSWLKDHGTTGLDHIEFKPSNRAGLGCFAKKTFEVGDNLFVIPHNCILTFGKVLESSSIQILCQEASRKGLEEGLTAELLVWLYMCEEINNSSSHFGPYLRSLDRQNLPTMARWGKSLLEALAGTNLAASIADIFPSIANKLLLLSRIAESPSTETKPLSNIRTVATDDTLLWARSHYLSRRYPARFGGDEESYVDRLQQCSREVGLANMGCLCPLLDILNHKSDVEWLRFQVTQDALQVICNHRIEEGNELYSNYGSQSNEMFLYAYGFALSDNVDDAVTVRLMQGVNSKTNSTNTTKSEGLGTFYIRSGGMDGIPADLWRAVSGCSQAGSASGSEGTPRSDESGDESEYGSAVEIDVGDCQLLHSHLYSKLLALERHESGGNSHNNNTEQSNVGPPVKARRCANHGRPLSDQTAVDPRIGFIAAYREGQRSILNQAIAALADTIASAEQDSDESEFESENVA